MKKNHLNLPRVMRVAVCAGLVALCVAGAGLFPVQPVAGQEPEPVTLHGAAALDQLKQAGQYESLQAAMNQARFSVSHTTQTPLGRAAWHAPNRAAGYDAYITESGVSIAVNDESYVSLSLHSLGYGAALRAVAPGEVSGDQQTINLTREGGVREWYVNGPEGLEHGFTLSEPPGARQGGTPLRLALQVNEGWRAVASDDGKLVTLHGDGGQAVEYGKLVVRDNLGRNIAARLTVVDEQVVIEVEDHAAEYPLTIDPLFTLQQRLLAADGVQFDLLGYAVALSGNTALVGAPGVSAANVDQGAAYIFVRNGATWTQQAKLLAQDGGVGELFGVAVALDGDTALVGATPTDPDSLVPTKGAAYVFVRNGTTWTQQKKLTANDGHAFAQFGAAVALDGDTALVGAPNHQIIPDFVNTGAAYVFVRNGTAWTQQVRLEANDAGGGDRFGEAVALDGDTALVGAPKDDVGTNSDQGSAYLFTRSGTSWTQRQKLTTTDSAANDQFGNAVALSGATALIGAYLYGSDDSGKVFTFKRDGTGWALTDGRRAPNPTAFANFGVSVALSGDTAVIGASLGLFQPGVDQRSTYVFVGGGDWLLVRHLGPELGTADDRFGYAVALDGDTVLVGAYRGNASASAQGAAYAFVLHDSRHVEQQKLTANDGGADEYFGGAVALDGDTLVVGADTDTIGTNAEQGSVYVFTCQGAVWTFQQKLTANDGAAEDYFGYAVALSGNTLAVGANGDDIGGKANQGSAYIFTRNGTVWAQQQKLTVGMDGAAGDNFGRSVALGGQTVVMGASGVDNNRGAAYVFTRQGTVWTEQAKLFANDGAAGDEFGRAVALSGDTLAVGAFLATVGTNLRQGSAYVFTGAGTAWTQQPKLTANDGGPSDFFGVAVALDGDTLAVGAGNATIGANRSQGSVYVFTRQGTAWTQQPKLTANDGGANDYFGSAVALSGSILVVGANGDTIGTSSGQGSAYVFTFVGRWYQQQKLTASDGRAGDSFGGAVALSGDTLLVGAARDNIGTNSNQGSAYVFVSPSCPAITIAPDSLPNGVIGAAYNQPLTASGGSAGEYRFSVTSGALPPGVRVSGDVGLSGTPTATGTYRFTITATYYFSLCTGSREYTLRVTPPCPPITVEPETLPGGTTGAAYSQSFTATGGAAPYSFAVTAGALPPGLSLSAGGVLSGTPTQPGSFPFTITATDGNGCAETRAVTLAVNPAPTPTPTPTPTPSTGASSVQLNSDVYSVDEGAGRATLTLTRGGNVSSTASVDYATSDTASFVPCGETGGAASARCDYATSLNTVSFAAGETTRTFTIPITDDGFVETSETFTVTLTNPVNTSLGAQSTAQITITDNDAAGSANPIAAASFFVRQQYIDFLSREPEPAGFDAWLAVLNRCGGGGAGSDPACDRIEVSASFFRSDEFQFKGYFVYRYYRATLGRRPSYAEIIPDMQRVSGATGDEVVAKRGRFAEEWVERAEFRGRYQNLSNAQFVDELLRTADVQLSIRNQLVADLDAGRQTRAQAVRRVVESAEVNAREYNGAFVAMQYFGYLRRDPEEAGYQDWLRVINANPQDYRTMVGGFVTSVEYRSRFGAQ